MKTKKRGELTLHDRLSHLTYTAACKLLGPKGLSLLHAGGKVEIDPATQVRVSEHCFELRLPDAVVEISLGEDRPRLLRARCSACSTVCAHVGAAVSFVLEEKLLLGLAAAPRERVPIESLDEQSLVERALEERAERARTERMTVRPARPEAPYGDYQVTSTVSGKSYKVALRGTERGDSFCSCPDFRKNTLGTCKHIVHLLGKLERRFSRAVMARPYRRTEPALHLRYGREVELRLALPARPSPALTSIAKPLADKAITDLPDLLRRLRRLQAAGQDVKVYPDAEAHVERCLRAERLRALSTEIRRDPAGHALRNGLLSTELLPYQLDGIAFAVGAGRAILADDMGLGKTIQGIGVAELLAREVGIKRVLIVCPTSLKSQWRNEITRFSRRDCRLVLGGAAERATQYADDCFFTICNYEQVLRDLLAIERAPWDLVILDEGQRIKNWETETSRVIKGLTSPFALVLSGTPLENRLDELYSVVEFVDERRLGPAYRFLNRHRVTDERGKVLGYRNLDELRRALAPILLRRTRAEVLGELPERTTEVLRIAPTDEQRELHGAHKRVVASIVTKAYISEMDLLRLRTALLMCRLAANTTRLVDKQAPGYSSKLERLDELLGRLATEPDRKTILFSEWTGMLDLVEPLLGKHGLAFVRLDGSVPQKKRQALVHEFQHAPECRVFLATNAGSTGLNLQAANTVINVDLPWNPAVLEQRIGRAHRMGQKRPVQVFLLVTEDTIEEELLKSLAAKRDLALAALDPESEVSEVDLVSGVDELKRRLEVLLGARPDAPVDESERTRVAAEAAQLERRERMAAAAGQMLTAALAFLGELAPVEAEPAPALVGALASSLRECVESDAQGRLRLTVTLPSPGEGVADASATLQALARSLAQLTSARPTAQA